MILNQPQQPRPLFSSFSFLSFYWFFFCRFSFSLSLTFLWQFANISSSIKLVSILRLFFLRFSLSLALLFNWLHRLVNKKNKFNWLKMCFLLRISEQKIETDENRFAVKWRNWLSMTASIWPSSLVDQVFDIAYTVKTDSISKGNFRLHVDVDHRTVIICRPRKHRSRTHLCKHD